MRAPFRSMLPDTKAELLAVGKADPRYGAAMLELGRIYLAENAHKRAARAYAAAAAAGKGVDAYIGLGNAASAQGDHGAALKHYDRALAADPGCATAQNNRGNALAALKKPEEAAAAYRAALDARPDYADALVNLGHCLRTLGRLAEARRCYARAERLVPGHPKARFGRCLVDLAEGMLPAAWDGYEARWHPDNLTSAARAFERPAWRGEGGLAGKTVFLHAEQGLGDTIQFCRYAAAVKALGARVILEAPAPLRRLLATLDGPDELLERDAQPPPYHEHCPLASLPRAFATTLDTIPAAGGYLAAEEGLRAHWRERIGERRRLRVGIAWRGNRANDLDRLRSLPLPLLKPLLARGHEFFALQHDLDAREAAALRGKRNVVAPGRGLGDFASTAALVDLLDVVISVDTATAHLAGALGKPVWILLALGGDWRWLRGREDSPWYRSARLFRQRAFDDWPEVIARVAQVLDALAESNALDTQ